jgi:hypothetical protein
VLLWDYFDSCRFILLEDQLHCSLQQARLLAGQSLLLEPVGQVSLMETNVDCARVNCSCAHAASCAKPCGCASMHVSRH